METENIQKTHHCGCGSGACACSSINIEGGGECECYDNCSCGCEPYKNSGAEPVPPYLVLVVGRMTCGGCMDSVSKILKPLNGVSGDIYIESSTRHVFVPGTPDPVECIQKLEDAGFKPKLKDNYTEVTKFLIKGMTCGSCTSLISNTLGRLKGVTGPVSVDLASGIAIVPGKPDVKECIDELSIFDYHATVIGPVTIDFKVEGMTCKGCISTVTTAIKGIEGVLDVHLDFDSRIVTVCGNGITFERCKEELEIFDYTAVKLGEENIDNIKPIEKKKKKKVQPEVNIATMPKDPSLTLTEFSISGMTCASCVHTIETSVATLSPVKKISVQLLSEKAIISFDGTKINASEIALFISDMGYPTYEIQKSTPGRIIIEVKRTETFQKGVVGSILADLSKNSNQSEYEVLNEEDAPVDKDTMSRQMVSFIQDINGVNSVTKEMRSDAILLTVDYDVKKIKGRDIIWRLNENDRYPCQLYEEKSTQDALARKKEIREYTRLLIIALIFTVPAVIIGMGLHFIHSVDMVLSTPLLPGLTIKGLTMWLLVTPVQFYVGKGFYVNSWYSLRKLKPTMDVLIALGTSAAYFTSFIGIIMSMVYQDFTAPDFFETSAALIAFVMLGRFLENQAKARTSLAVTKLFGLQATDAILLEGSGDDTREVVVPVNLIETGDRLKVIPGAKIPCDGVVVYGKSSVNEAMITGESMPVTKNVGDAVIGSTVNQSGVMQIEATKIGEDTALSQIIKLVADAQASKGKAQELADKISGYFVPVIILAAVIDFAVWFTLLELGVIPQSYLTEGTTNFTFALLFAITVLVIACPCALGLATPTAVMVGTGLAAKFYVLIKGGDVLEQACKLTHILFDKTGTLTMGIPKVTEVQISKINEMEFWQIVGSAEADSEHSLGRCIAEYAKQINSDQNFISPSKFKAISGMGIRCVIKGRKVSIGNRKLMDKYSLVIPENYEEMMVTYEKQGKTAMLVGIDNSVVGLIAVSDPLRPEAQSVIDYLHSRNIVPIIISGDNKRTVSTIASQLNIDTYYAEVFPADKKNKVEELQKQGFIVGMIGDGINDAPALSQADVGIAVGSGTDVALESASIVLMRTHLTDIILALDISAATYRRIKINFCWAFGYNIIAVPLAAGCFYPLMKVTIPPWVAGLAMALSSVSVLVSSLLLKRYTAPKIWRECNTNSNSLINDD